MKSSLFLAALAALSTVPFAAPANAQYCSTDGSCAGSANESLRRDAAHSRASSGYDSYDGSLVGTVINRAIFGNPYQSRKPKDGELRTLPDGTSVSYHKKSRQWVVVNRPTSQPRGVYSDRDVYVAN